MRAEPALLIAGALLLAGCGGGNYLKGDGPPSGSMRIPDLPDDAVPRPEPRSKYGNGPVYEVLGKRYTVMESSENYQERGVASWYGKKFHGNLTSNREVYDMYAMTAAHKSLPLPTYVRVHNLKNNTSVVVRVNDRGPFLHNRLIDLSYAAAMKLDMLRDGTSLVEVTAINFEEPAGDRPVRRATPPAPAEPIRATPAAIPVFVQVGAFGDRANAELRLNELSRAGIGNAFIDEERTPERALYRVRIGPVASVAQYDMLVTKLERIGIDDPYLIND
ncbi:MAG: septal ring lytic transglycosylase RlpA family protein [Woeseiaceae bacterium]|nr:septal ring lytic transglycosylase RlpA family protein [Woeseiaceae bacterium]